MIRRFLRRQDGTGTVELALTLPILLAILFTAVDFGVLMLRQVFLDRAVDIAVREVRLGRISGNGLDTFRAQVCAGTILTPNCVANTAIEMRPVDPVTWAGLDAPVQCVNRAEDIAPVLTFNPGARQDLMLIRVCTVVRPFIGLSGLILGLPRGPSGEHTLVSRGAFTNEP